MIFQLQKLFLVERGQRRGSNIELQMNSGRDFVHILPARTLRAHRMDIDLRIRDGDVGRNMKHRGYLIDPFALTALGPTVITTQRQGATLKSFQFSTTWSLLFFITVGR